MGEEQEERRALTRSLVSLMTHSCLAHWPSHFLRQRKAQMRASRISSMLASGEGHWWGADLPLLLSSRELQYNTCRKETLHKLRLPGDWTLSLPSWEPGPPGRPAAHVHQALTPWPLCSVLAQAGPQCLSLTNSTPHSLDP